MGKTKSKFQKWSLICLVFIILITGVRILWMNYLITFDYSEETLAEQGIIDLRDLNLTNNQTLPLNGEWEFYPSTHLSPKEVLESNDSIHKKVFLNVLDTWDDAFHDDNPFRFGTYRLRILLDDDHVQSFGLRTNQIRSASAIYINGELVGKAGEPATVFDSHQASDVPYTVNFNLHENVIDLVIHVSNYTHVGDGGIINPIRFGSSDAIDFRTTLSVGLNLLLVVVLVIHGIYGILLFFLGAKHKGLLFFSLLISSAIISVLASDDRLLFVWFSLPYEWTKTVIYLSYISVSAFIPYTIKNLYPIRMDVRILRVFAYYCGLFALLVIVAPYSYSEGVSRLMLIIVLLSSVTISVSIIIKVMKNSEDFIFLLIACLSIGTSILWPTISKYAGIEWMHYPFDLIIAILAFSAFWFRRFFRATDETKQLAEKLQHENEKKDEFLVNTSHELRNPLHVIINMTGSILNNETDRMNSEQRKRLETMNNVSQRMSIMLDDLIDVTRLKENTVQLNLTEVKIDTLIAGVVDMVRFMLDGKPCKLQVKLPKDLPAVNADENRIIQVLFNLLHNAVKFTDDGTITVYADYHNKMARIHVKDTGIGIKEEEIGTIFEPYEQTHMNAARESGGFGLGLSISKQLVELHGGTLSVESMIGEGSLFTFTLPLFECIENSKDLNLIPITTKTIETSATLTDIPKSPSKLAVATSKLTKLLIIDDDSVNLTVLYHILVEENYEITTVTSGKEALSELKNKRYDLIISDVMMPNMSGYELTEHIRKRFTLSELPILLLTARSRSEDSLTGFKSGANDYVIKPVDADELRARVRALTDLKHSIEERLRMEGAWLQSQIQPHFLFNTLNSISALGMMDVSKMQALLEEFSTYLRLSFDFKNAEPVVPLEHELALVRSYLFIEKNRFGDRINVQWDIESGIDFELPPLSIQPIVENAIGHGILKRMDGGKICIKIEQKDEYYKITVSDDGKGMTEEKLGKLLLAENIPGERQGVGLRNIDRRLKQLYNIGLTIKSELDTGTSVSFQVYELNKD